jgi:dTDP-4-dehydrorhamnose reductase
MRVKILILGGDGMLGHQLLESWRGRHDVWVTLRNSPVAYARYGRRFGDTALFGVDVRDLQAVVHALAVVKPSAVVNAVGVIKQRPTAKESIPSIEITAAFPHRLAELTEVAGCPLIQVSTDCVFSGRKGNYSESDEPDAMDLYGRSKLLGEVDAPHCLTIRSSIIGLELTHKRSLVEWFLAQRGSIRGYSRAIYSGMTTQEMARAIEYFLVTRPDVSGVCHLSSRPISKYDLLQALAGKLSSREVVIDCDEEFFCDRSLDSSALERKVDYRVASWDLMLDELAEAIRRRGRSA